MHHVSDGAPKKAAVRDKPLNWQATRNGSREAARGVASMANPSVTTRAEADAVVFSIQFYGKTIGEVGLMDQDLSQLDWQRFKSYIVSEMLSGTRYFCHVNNNVVFTKKKKIITLVIDGWIWLTCCCCRCYSHCIYLTRSIRCFWE